MPGVADGMEQACFFRHSLALDERRVKFLPEYANEGFCLKYESGTENQRKIFSLGIHKTHSQIHNC